MRFQPGMMASAEMLSLRKCVNSYIVLRESLDFSPDPRLYFKIICDYRDEMPIFEVGEIVSRANGLIPWDSYLELLEAVFAR